MATFSLGTTIQELKGAKIIKHLKDDPILLDGCPWDEQESTTSLGPESSRPALHPVIPANRALSL